MLRRIKQNAPTMPRLARKVAAQYAATKAARTALVAAKRSMPPMRSSKNLRTGGYLGIEYKFTDQVISPALVVATVAGAEVDPATTLCLNNVAEGDGESQRIGRKYTITSVHVQGQVSRQNRNNQTEIGDANFVKIALVLDTQTNAAQLNSEDVFTSPGSGALAFKNLQYAKRFKILHQETIAVPAGAPSWNGVADELETGGTSCPFQINKKLNIPVLCKGTSANVSDITDNSLHMIAMANLSAASASGIEIVYTSRVRFVG